MMVRNVVEGVYVLYENIPCNFVQKQNNGAFLQIESKIEVHFFRMSTRIRRTFHLQQVR